MLTTAPNMLTLSRVALVPLIVAILHIDAPWARYLACALFVAAATTDYVDGWLARSWRQQSPFGRWLDPIADKLLVAATLLVLIAFHRAPLLPAVVIVLREITVSGLREYLAEVSIGLPVSRLAKWKTAVQMTAIGFLIVGNAGPSWLPVSQIGWWGLWLAAVLTVVSAWDYLRFGMGHMLASARVRACSGDPAGRPLVHRR